MGDVPFGTREPLPEIARDHRQCFCRTYEPSAPPLPSPPHPIPLVPPLSPSPPPPSPLSPPPPQIPASGIAILAGNSETNNASFCLWPGDEAVISATDWPISQRSDIAAQCCKQSAQPARDDCRRRATSSGEQSTSKDDCIAGVLDIRPSFPPGNFKVMTYGETVTKCASLALTLCDQSCYGKGCSYNGHPVYTGLPCPFPRPLLYAPAVVVHFLLISEEQVGGGTVER